MVKDNVFDVAAFENFLNAKFKVNGKAGNLGTTTSIKRDGSIVTVTSAAPFPKSYLKYLTKKFLKKQLLRDWLHVIATGPEAYELKYFNITQDNAEAEE